MFNHHRKSYDRVEREKTKRVVLKTERQTERGEFKVQRRVKLERKILRLKVKRQKFSFFRKETLLTKQIKLKREKTRLILLQL